MRDLLIAAATEGLDSAGNKGSPVLAQVIAGLFLLAVGAIGGWATRGSAAITAREERRRISLEHEQFYADRRDQAEKHYRTAFESLDQVASEILDVGARRAAATGARTALLQLRWTLGGEIGGSRFEELLAALHSGSERNLEKAVALWPNVDRAIRKGFPARKQ